MQDSDIAPVARLGLTLRFLARIASADAETLAPCPRQDHETVSDIAIIMIFTALYQCALFTVVGNHLFGTPGRFEPAILGVSAFISLFIMRIDAFTIMRSGWHLNGISTLKRCSLDISGGLIERIKSGVLLTFRVSLALGSAQLTAIFACIFVFAADIDARIESDNARMNAPLVAAASERVDAEITRRRDTVAAQKEDIEKEIAVTSALRDQENALASSEPRLQGAQDEIKRLNEAKSKLDDEVQTAEAFALNEAAGIKGGPNNSGQVGEGVRFRAASEQVTNTKAHAAEVTASLTDARRRLDDLTKQFSARTDGARRHIEEQINSNEASVTTANSQLASIEADLARMVTDRESAIEAAVHSSPDYVPKRTGLLIQIAALHNLADGNPEIAIVILLIELTSFGLEFAAVLAKVTSFVPTTYSAFLARDAYMRGVAVVDEMVQELDKRRPPPPALEANIEAAPDIDVANDNIPGFEPMSLQSGLESLGDDPTPPPQPPKRPRGRPRKAPAE